MPVKEDKNAPSITLDAAERELLAKAAEAAAKVAEAQSQLAKIRAKLLRSKIPHQFIGGETGSW